MTDAVPAIVETPRVPPVDGDTTGTAQTPPQTTPQTPPQTAPGSATTAAQPPAAGLSPDAAGRAAGNLADQAAAALDRAGEAVTGAVDHAVEVTREAVTHVAERMRNTATLPAQRGRTHIANEVVEKIAGRAAREVPGVYDLGGDVARAFETVRERLHLGEESAGRGVSVRLDGVAATVEITLVIEFGFVVSSVTDKVREKVISAVESMLGLEVTSVDIVVDDVHLDNDGPIGDDAARAAGYLAETEAITVG